MIAEILRGSEYSLTLFSADEVAALKLFEKNGKPYLECLATLKPRPAKPEEIVRQLYLQKLMEEYGYARDRIALEKRVYFGSTVHEKAADIVVWEKGTTDTPYIIVECKKPKRKDGLEQLKSYCNAEGSPIGVWTNGGETIYLHREDPNLFRSLDGIPRADQTLADMLNQPWTLADLEKENILVAERTSLKDIILDMEDLVLANAGVDAFEEVFKLIYAKLYDEARAARSAKGKRNLEFRVGGRTPREFAEVVDNLFAKACGEWPGVFQQGERIGLEPDHLKVCGSALERVKLFNSNLSVIDEAFEYLSIKASKGEKGQYFTPRHVIDMCVKMLNPSAEEYVVDTAAGHADSRCILSSTSGATYSRRRGRTSGRPNTPGRTSTASISIHAPSRSPRRSTRLRATARPTSTAPTRSIPRCGLTRRGRVCGRDCGASRMLPTIRRTRRPFATSISMCC